MVEQFESWADEFDGPYEIFALGARRIMVLDPVEANRILAHRPTTFKRGSNNVSFKWATGRHCWLVGEKPL